MPMVAAASMALGASVANAATLTFYNDLNPNDTQRFTLECSLGCSAAEFSTDDPTVLGDFVGWNAADGDGDLINNLTGAQASTDFVNLFTGNTFDKDADRNFIDGGGVSGAMFFSSAEFLLIKIGKSPNVGLIWNTGGANNKFTFSATKGTGSGLSGIEEFGDNDFPPGGIIPVPAGLPLLLSAMGVFAIVRARKRKAA